MDRSLDDIVAERQRSSNRAPKKAPTAPRRGNYGSYPRDGVRKVRLPLEAVAVQDAHQQQSTRDDRPNLDNDWTHDRFDDEKNTRSGYSQPRGRRDDLNTRDSPERDRAPPPAKLRVDNLHYDLTEEDIYDLFARIAPVEHASLRYDRAGRSEGVAFVTYAHVADARTAITEFDGANAKGQPIRLTLLPLGPSAGRSTAARRDNPFDRVENPKSLFDRIEAPGGRRRRRSESPVDDDRSDPRRLGQRRGAAALSRDRRSDVTKPAPENIDRYVPGQSSERSPRRNGGGRRPGERREREVGRGSGRERGENGGRMVNGRPRKTQEELDAEMDDYWGNSGNAGATEAVASTSTKAPQPEGPSVAPAATELDEDIDMIE